MNFAHICSPTTNIEVLRYDVRRIIGVLPLRFCGTKGGSRLIDTPPGVGGCFQILAANGQIGHFLAAKVILAAQAARLIPAAKALNRSPDSNF